MAILVTFEIWNDTVKQGSSFEKEFKDETEMYNYMREQNEHPFLALVLVDIKKY